MIGVRVKLVMAGSAAFALAAPVQAQMSDEIVLNILRECAKIGDATARLACYDNNIRSAGGEPAATTSFGSPPARSSAPVSTASGAAGFGGESVRTPDRFQTPEGQVDRIEARIASITQRQPGIYAFTLADGAEWLFTEGVSRSYRLPRQGDTVSIQRGAIGSFLMRFDNQPMVRVRRTR